MNKFDRSTMETPRSISQTELAKFLVQLADIYASPEYGNRPLSEALRDLAATVKRTEKIKARRERLERKSPQELSLGQANELRELDQESIRTFLADENKTKAELLRLASVRFSMPISQLKRMKTDEVRQTINAALLHENSIEILSEESVRDGANRNS